jgi:hypothetical protein
VENSVLLTTAHAVATSARFREIWSEAQREVLASRPRVGALFST